MISHIFIGVKDFDRAYRFYAELMALLGNSPRFCDRERPWAGWQSQNKRLVPVLQSMFE